MTDSEMYLFLYTVGCNLRHKEMLWEVFVTGRFGLETTSVRTDFWGVMAMVL